jgi:hypothetical protein
MHRRLVAVALLTMPGSAWARGPEDFEGTREPPETHLIEPPPFLHEPDPMTLPTPPDSAGLRRELLQTRGLLSEARSSTSDLLAENRRLVGDARRLRAELAKARSISARPIVVEARPSTDPIAEARFADLSKRHEELSLEAASLRILLAEANELSEAERVRLGNDLAGTRDRLSRVEAEKERLVRREESDRRRLVRITLGALSALAVIVVVVQFRRAARRARSSLEGTESAQRMLPVLLAKASESRTSAAGGPAPGRE